MLCIFARISLLFVCALPPLSAAQSDDLETINMLTVFYTRWFFGNIERTLFTTSTSDTAPKELTEEGWSVFCNHKSPATSWPINNNIWLASILHTQLEQKERRQCLCKHSRYLVGGMRKKTHDQPESISIFLTFKEKFNFVIFETTLQNRSLQSANFCAFIEKESTERKSEHIYTEGVVLPILYDEESQEFYFLEILQELPHILYIGVYRGEYQKVGFAQILRTHEGTVCSVWSPKKIAGLSRSLENPEQGNDTKPYPYIATYEELGLPSMYN